MACNPRTILCRLRGDVQARIVCVIYSVCTFYGNRNLLPAAAESFRRMPPIQCCEIRSPSSGDGRCASSTMTKMSWPSSLRIVRKASQEVQKREGGNWGHLRTLPVHYSISKGLQISPARNIRPAVYYQRDHSIMILIASCPPTDLVCLGHTVAGNSSHSDPPPSFS